MTVFKRYAVNMLIRRRPRPYHRLRSPRILVSRLFFPCSSCPATLGPPGPEVPGLLGTHDPPGTRVPQTACGAGHRDAPVYAYLFPGGDLPTSHWAPADRPRGGALGCPRLRLPVPWLGATHRPLGTHGPPGSGVPRTARDAGQQDAPAYVCLFPGGELPTGR